MTPFEDLYIAFSGVDDSSGVSSDFNDVQAIFKVFVNPLQSWLWAGSILLIYGAVVLVVSQFLANQKPHPSQL